MKRKPLIIFASIAGLWIIISLIFNAPKTVPSEKDYVSSNDVISDVTSNISKDVESIIEYEGSPYDDPDFVPVEQNPKKSELLPTTATEILLYINTERYNNNETLLYSDTVLQKYTDELVEKRATKKSTDSDKYNSVVCRFKSKCTSQDIIALYDFSKLCKDKNTQYMAVSVYYGKQQDMTYMVITTSDTENKLKEKAPSEDPQNSEPTASKQADSSSSKQ